jgi:hypothetical protein
MKRRIFFKIAGFSAASALAPGVFASETKNDGTYSNRLSNPFRIKGNWYKAALHVHTTTSDGDVDVPTRLKRFSCSGNY